MNPTRKQRKLAFPKKPRNVGRGRWMHCLRGHDFTVENTYRKPDGTRQCRKCAKEFSKFSDPQYRKEVKKRFRGKHLIRIRNENRREARTSRTKVKAEILQAYGGKCACCGENRPEFMTIDHIYGDGKKDRESIGSGVTMYFRLRRMGFPKDRYRLLCYNCNLSRGHNGFCPHERENKNGDLEDAKAHTG